MTKKRQQTNFGCLRTILTIVLAVVIYSTVNSFFAIPFYLGMAGAYLAAHYMTTSLFFRTQKQAILAKIGRSIFPVIVVVLCILLHLNKNTTDKNSFFENEEQQVTLKDSLINGKTIKLASHKRSWIDYLGNTYNGELNVAMNDYYSSAQFHKSMNITYPTEDFWGKVYAKIHNEDTNKLYLIYEELERLGKKMKLDRRSFAEMVVACIQDIPYALVFQEPCLASENYEKYIQDILEECPDCCIGNQKYGIQTPVAFMANLKGDCDTRTLIIFTILNHFGYDVAILNSDFYRHSVFGINLPARGLYKTHYNKRYYLWETTNKYFKIGELSNQLSDVRYWHVVLTNK